MRLRLVFTFCGQGALRWHMLMNYLWLLIVLGMTFLFIWEPRLRVAWNQCGIGMFVVQEWWYIITGNYPGQIANKDLGQFFFQGWLHNSFGDDVGSWWESESEVGDSGGHVDVTQYEHRSLWHRRWPLLSPGRQKGETPKKIIGCCNEQNVSNLKSTSSSKISYRKKRIQNMSRFKFSRTVLEQKQWSKTTHLTILTCSGGTGWPWTQKQDRKGEVPKLHKNIRHSVAKAKMPSLHSCFISTGAPNAAGAVGKGMMCPSASNLDVMAAIVAQHYKGLERGNCGSGKHRLRRCDSTWKMK